MPSDLVALRADAARLARTAFQSVPANSADVSLLRRLSDANAFAAVCASAASLDVFPMRVPVDALLPLANLFSSVGRERQIAGRLNLALARFIRALDLIRVLRGFRQVSEIEKAAYWSMSRAAQVVGELAAGKKISLGSLLDDFDSNMNAYRDLLGAGDYKAPRAIAAIAMVSEAISNSNGSSYTKSLLDELASRSFEIEPMDDGARRRFRAQMSSLVGQLELADENATAGWRWSTN